MDAFSKASYLLKDGVDLNDYMGQESMEIDFQNMKDPDDYYNNNNDDDDEDDKDKILKLYNEEESGEESDGKSVKSKSNESKKLRTCRRYSFEDKVIFFYYVNMKCYGVRKAASFSNIPKSTGHDWAKREQELGDDINPSFSSSRRGRPKKPPRNLKKNMGNS